MILLVSVGTLSATVLLVRDGTLSDMETRCEWWNTA